MNYIPFAALAVGDAFQTLNDKGEPHVRCIKIGAPGGMSISISTGPDLIRDRAVVNAMLIEPKGDLPAGTVVQVGTNEAVIPAGAMGVVVIEATPVSMGDLFKRFEAELEAAAKASAAVRAAAAKPEQE